MSVVQVDGLIEAFERQGSKKLRKVVSPEPENPLKRVLSGTVQEDEEKRRKRAARFAALDGASGEEPGKPAGAAPDASARPELSAVKSDVQ
eukprot:scaffold603363_cov37-Prasinocladus_malaysianus.AAC.1